ncbi:MAG: PAS domain S-box protein [Thermodesulfobacteriota bacterium]
MENKLIVNNASMAIVTADQDGAITSWNPAAEIAFGRSSDDVLGKGLNEVVIVDGDNDEEFLALLAADGDPKIQFERTIRCPGREPVPFEFDSSRVAHGNGEIFLVFAREISKRRQRQEALLNAYRNQRIMNSILNVSLLPVPFDEQLEMILDYILSIPTIKLLPTGAILLVGDQPDSLSLKVQRGFSEQQLATCCQVPFGKCHCGRAATSGEMQFVECIDEGHDFIFDKMKPHGHYCVPIKFNETVLGVIALYIEEGHQSDALEVETISAIANVVAGIVERRKMEGQLEDLVQGLRETIKDLDNEKGFNESIISSMASGIIVLDGGGRVEKSNPVARQMIGCFEEDDIKGKTLLDFLEKDVVESLMKLEDLAGVKRSEIPLVHQDGQRRIIEYMTVSRREDGSELGMGIIINLKDVTDYRKIQAEMEKMNRFSTIAEIASAVAHEVRNPLAGIMTMSQAIDEQMVEGDSKKEYIGRIIRQVDRLNVILTDFFTYARPPKPQKKKVALKSIVDEIRPFMRNKMVKCGIELHEEYPENVPDILVDPNQIQQVLLNLMLNSIYAIKVGGSIDIKAEYLGEDREGFGRDKFPWLKTFQKYVVVYFRDSGCGMPQEVVDRVFEPFFTTKHDGTGLGMAIVFRILKENNAGIHVESSESKGTTFFLFFSVD